MAWRISLLARTEGRGGNEHVWTETPGILRSALQPGIQRLSDVGLTSAVALNIYSLRPPGSSALAHHGPVLSPPLPPPCLQSWCNWGGGEGWKFVFFFLCSIWQYPPCFTEAWNVVKSLLFTRLLLNLPFAKDSDIPCKTSFQFFRSRQIRCCFQDNSKGMALVVQWLRILLPVQRMWVHSLDGKLRSHV